MQHINEEQEKTKIHKKMLNPKDDTEYNLMNELYVLDLKKIMICQNCGYHTTKTETKNFIFYVDLKESDPKGIHLNDLIRRVLNPETRMLECEACSRTCRKEYKLDFMIADSPKCLIIQVKRWVYHRNQDVNVSKLSTSISVPEMIRINSHST